MDFWKTYSSKRGSFCIISETMEDPPTTRSSTNNVGSDGRPNGDGCTKTLVRHNDDTDGTCWILEEVRQPASRAMPLNNDSPSSDTCHGFWLVRNVRTNELTVQPTNFDNFDKLSSSLMTDSALELQIFRLYRCTLPHASATTGTPAIQVSASQQPTSHLLATGESPLVGTKLLWDDPHVKIWEFRLAPHEQCDFHRHLHPYVFLNLTESLTQELDLHGQIVQDKPPNHQVQGQCTFVAHEHLSAHAVLNVGTNLFLQFIVEFLS